MSYTLNQGITTDEVIRLTDAISYSSYSSSTDTPLGLRTAAQDLFTSSAGDRPGVNNFGLVITDGAANLFLGQRPDPGNVLNMTADELKQKGKLSLSSTLYYIIAMILL